MKKLFALLLAAIMLLSTIPFIASAANADVATGIELNSLADFYGVKTVAGENAGDPDTYAITNLVTGDMNVKLMADITFGEGTVVTLPMVAQDPLTEEYKPVIDETTQQVRTHEWTFGEKLDRGLVDSGFEGTFDGNGHSIVYTGNYENPSSAGFFSNGEFNGTLKNLTLGSKDNPINALMGKTSGGSNCGLIASQNNANKVLVENVVVYGNLTVQGTGARNVGFFFGKTMAGITLNNCRAYGTITVNQTKANQHVTIGGFVGRHICNLGDGAPIYFNSCYSDVDIAYAGENASYETNQISGVGGLLGVNSCNNGDTEFYATNCVTVGDLPENVPGLAIGAGRLIGQTVLSTKTAEELTCITDCQKPVFNAVGASIKIADGTLRFRTGVAIYNAYVDMYGAANVKVGVIYAEKSVADGLIAQSNFKIDATGVTNVVATELDNGNIYADVAATATSYGTEYTALGYISYYNGTEWVTEYAEASTTRSVSAVATAALADVKDVQGNGYGYATADGKYCFYTAEQQTKLASYVVASAS